MRERIAFFESSNNSNNDKNAQRNKIVQSLLLEIPQGDFLLLKAKLIELFQLRSSSSIDKHELKKRVDTYNEHYDHFIKQESPDGEFWYRSDLISKITPLFIESIILADTILAGIENEIRSKKNHVDANSIADLLTDQGESYCFYFIYSGVIDLYHEIRGGMIYGRDRDGNRYRFALFDTENDSYQKLFLDENNPRYLLRKLYNVFIKHGFLNYHGGEEFKSILRKHDERFEIWTRYDSKQPDKLQGRGRFYIPVSRPT